MFQQPDGIEDPPTAPIQLSEGEFPVDQPPPRTTRVVDRFEKDPVNANSQIKIKHGKRTVTAEKKEGLLFMRSSNVNRKADKPQLTVIDLKQRKFGDQYGDHTGIKMWGYEHELQLLDKG